MTDTSDGAGCSSTREFLASTRLVEAAEMPEITSSPMLSGPDLAARAMCSRICSPPPNTRYRNLGLGPTAGRSSRSKQTADGLACWLRTFRQDGRRIQPLSNKQLFYLRPLRRSINGLRVGESSLLCIQDDPALADSYDLRNGGRKRSWSRPSATPTGRFNWSSTGERNGGVGLRPIRRR